ncbi:MAG: efflux RND transporter periplasmic adaptor subunit [Thermodesulfobacteriota bacterium]|nr:efflux RND transporter periplasmic adaptor subunit [Thermodesulfobacteriota bacterium]
MNILCKQLLLIIGVVITILFNIGCSETKSAEDLLKQTNHVIKNNHDHECENGKRHEKGHGHEEGSDLEMSIEEIQKILCEHNKKTIECDNCRYEVGVVSISPELISRGKSGGLIKIGKAILRNMDGVIHTTGEVQVNEDRTVLIRSRASGNVERVHVDYGSQVKAGDPLVTIDSFALGKTVAELRKAYADLDLARKTFKREEILYKKQINSQKEWLDAKTELDKALIEFKTAKRMLELYGLKEQEIKEIITHSNPPKSSITISAPFDGTVIKKNVVLGAFVTPENEIMIIADISSLWIWAHIYERDLKTLLAAESQGEIHAVITVEAFSDYPFEGIVDYIGAVSDEVTRTVKVRIRVHNKDFLLRPGMFCKIDMHTGKGKNILAIPKEALLHDEGNQFVFKKMKGNYFIRRRVITGKDFGPFIEIIQGVVPDEEIVTSGSFILKSDVLRSKMGAGCAD